MKHLKQFLSDARRHKGLALIIVLSMLALATIVILAFLSVADTEHKATVTYSASQTARRYADTAVNIVISQLRSAAAREPEPAPGATNFSDTPVIHATQPGAARKYDQDGDFVAGYKLFSDANLIYRPTAVGRNQAGETGRTQERDFVASAEPPEAWDEENNLSRYVDLNEPVIKGVANEEGETAAVQTVFPIIDPRAGMDVDSGEGNIPVEGFSYDFFTAVTNRNLGDKVVKPGTAVQPDTLRLPMPVQWLYLLKDGTVGHLDEDLVFQSEEDGEAPSADNPMVGRIAFWTDDETLKVNINTASEPTFMGQPLYYHERDHRWCDFPATRSEYQRFPGHPATVALSSVLYPNPYQVSTRSLDTYRKTADDLERILTVKEKIYELMPRIHTDGSKGGTQLFDTDDYNNGATKATAVAIREALGERLYASVDELLFAQTASDGRRTLNVANYNGGVLFDKATLERTSAFLTASSRGSEVGIFGLPKVAMWPISTEVARRTGFDNLIAFCSKLSSGADLENNSYIFRRLKARDANYDISSIPRNVALMNMLDNLMHAKYPAPSDKVTLSGNIRGFSGKLGEDNQRQVLAEMFDYIRCTNLYDSYLAPTRDEWSTVGNTNWLLQYQTRDQLEATGFFKTYTPGYVKQPNNAGSNIEKPDNPFFDRALPGHGQVTPAEWRIGGNVYRGFGRSLSISEIGLHFICTADGQPDMYSWRLPEKDPIPQPPEDTVRNFIIPSFNIDNVDELEGQAWMDEDGRRDGRISGGRTALRLKQEHRNEFQVLHAFPVGFDGNGAIITNAAAENWVFQGGNPTPEPGQIKQRFYSNYPPLEGDGLQPGRYGTVAGPQAQLNPGKNYLFHPGYNWRNWNFTLPYNTCLDVDEKRVQALLHLEFFCPSVGYPEIHPEFTLVLDGPGVNSIKVKTVSGTMQPLFSTTKDVVIKSGGALYNPDDQPEVGGFASFRRLSAGRVAPGRDILPPDPGYVTDSTGDVHAGLTNLDLISSFFTVDRKSLLEFTGGLITIKIYDSHDYATRDPVQTIQFQLGDGRAPVPDLVVTPTYNVYQVRTDNSIYNHPTIQAPRWWTFNRGGALGRIQLENLSDPNGAVPVNPDDRNAYPEQFWNRGRIVQVADATVQATTASDITQPDGNLYQQKVPGANGLIYAYENVDAFKNVRSLDPDELQAFPVKRIQYDPATSYNRPFHFGSDSIRTIQPQYGDPRMIYLKKNVLASDWTRHVMWDETSVFMVHNFSSYHAGGEPGFDRLGVPSLAGGTSATEAQAVRRILPVRVRPSATGVMNGAYSPDAPANNIAHKAAQRYFDFDDSDPGGRVGPFINKPDEGNFSVGEIQPTGWPEPKRYRATYFRGSNLGSRQAAAGSSFFTPNRMVSSPIMMGSLPSAVFGEKGSMANPRDNDPNATGAWRNLLFRPHVKYADETSEAEHPGAGTAPPDHYLLDMFWMPMVEPYAISEALSTAGKVNMNYQIMPFTNIRRATALHAVLKGEQFAAMPNLDFDASKSMRTAFGANGSTPPVFRDESNESRFWHRNIVIDRFPPGGGTDTAWWVQSVADRVQGTLRQFEERFNFNAELVAEGHRGGLFRSPTQICEIHLIPSPVSSTAAGEYTPNVTAAQVSSYTGRNSAMATFWQSHCSTGDNTRERPYSNIYPKLTTRSNTFRVHVRAQTLRKATRSVDSDTFDPARDQVTAEFRGSFLLERYIDTRDATNPLPDYAAAADPFALAPLESFYRFRILESKRFAP